MTCPRSMAFKQVAELGLKPGPNPGYLRAWSTGYVGAQWEWPLLALPTADSRYITGPLPHAQRLSLAAGMLPQGTCPGIRGQGSTDLEPEGLA